MTEPVPRDDRESMMTLDEEMDRLEEISAILRAGDSVRFSKGRAGGPPQWKFKPPPDFDPQRTAPHSFFDEIEFVAGKNGEPDLLRVVRWRTFDGSSWGPIPAVMDIDNATAVSMLRMAIRQGLRVPRIDPESAAASSIALPVSPSTATQDPRRKPIRTFGDFCECLIRIAARDGVRSIRSSIDAKRKISTAAEKTRLDSTDTTGADDAVETNETEID